MKRLLVCLLLVGVVGCGKRDQDQEAISALEKLDGEVKRDDDFQLQEAGKIYDKLAVKDPFGTMGGEQQKKQMIAAYEHWKHSGADHANADKPFDSYLASEEKGIYDVLDAQQWSVLLQEVRGEKASSTTAQKTNDLTACPDCGGKVSKRAAACPHCGAPLSESTTTRVDDTDASESDRQTFNEFGRLVFKAIQNLNATELQYYHVQFSDIERLKKRLEQMVADPRKKSLVGQLPLFQQNPREEFADFQKEMSEGVFKFIKNVRNGESDISTSKLANSTYLGIAGESVGGTQGDDPLAQMVQELGVDVSKAGVGVLEGPAIFFESDGNVFEVRLPEFLFKLNHVWCMGGDAGFGGPRLLDSGDSESLLRLNHPDADAKAVIEKVQSLLRRP